MKRSLFAALASSAGLLLCWGVARAQQSPDVASLPPDMMLLSMEQSPAPDFGPMGPGSEGFELLGIEGMHPGKTVSGAPFSATATSESVQTLADGSHITRKSQTNLFRDGQGRFRRETTVQGFGPLAASGQPRTFIMIHDPVAGAAFVLEPDKKVARQLGKPGGHGHGHGGADKAEHAQHHGLGAGDNVQTEDLGKQVINGINAQGTRRTRTIPAGQIGNEKAITIVSESWYSPDLQMVVMSKRSDPRFGQTTYNLTNIQRKEPDAALFTVPAGYSIEHGGPGGRGMRRHGGPGPAGMPAEPPAAAPSF